MKQGLHLHLGQQLTMTPQLQQAIRLLQLSHLELKQEIQEALYSNPMLEMGDESEESNETVDDSGQMEVEDTPTAEFTEPVWEASESRPNNNSNTPLDIEFNSPQEETLKDHLIWQLNLTSLSETDLRIGEAIIDAVDPSGFLSESLDDILQGLRADLDVGLDEVMAVLHCIQRFDPAGVAARDLRDCLHIQLDVMPKEVAYRTEAMLIVDEYLAMVGNADLASIAKRCRMDTHTTEKAIELIRSLNPRPGYSVNNEAPDYIIPDVVVTKVGNDWKVSLNPDNAPTLKIANHYAELARDDHFAADRTYLREKLQEARWFIRSLESRNQTLLRVSNAIVERQKEFFDQGPIAMRPLILKDLAEILDLHESTVSRATSQKYLFSPRGLFELKYFFSSQISTNTGGECSSTAIKAILQELVAGENPAKPLSDNKLTDLLNQRGIMVARRTVAKYRETLGIEASSERKRMT